MGPGPVQAAVVACRPASLRLRAAPGNPVAVVGHPEVTLEEAVDPQVAGEAEETILQAKAIMANNNNKMSKMLRTAKKNRTVRARQQVLGATGKLVSLAMARRKVIRMDQVHQVVVVVPQAVAAVVEMTRRPTTIWPGS